MINLVLSYTKFTFYIHLCIYFWLLYLSLCFFCFVFFIIYYHYIVIKSININENTQYWNWTLTVYTTLIMPNDFKYVCSCICVFVYLFLSPVLVYACLFTCSCHHNVIVTCICIWKLVILWSPLDVYSSKNTVWRGISRCKFAGTWGLMILWSVRHKFNSCCS